MKSAVKSMLCVKTKSPLTFSFYDGGDRYSSLCIWFIFLCATLRVSLMHLPILQYSTKSKHIAGAMPTVQ